MSKFISEKTFKISFDDGEYMEFLQFISYENELELSKIENDHLRGAERIFYMLKSWNFKDENGNVPPITKEFFFTRIKKEVLEEVILKVFEKLAELRKEELKEKEPKEEKKN